MENVGNEFHRKLCETQNLAQIYGISVSFWDTVFIYLFFFSDCPVFLCFQVSCATCISRPTEQLCFIYKGHASAGQSIHAPGFTLSFLAHVKNTLVSMYATLKHPLWAEHGENTLSFHKTLFFLYSFNSSTEPDVIYTSFLRFSEVSLQFRAGHFTNRKV